jgi:glycosyltransferase involved in cell wall biosynthesis
MKEVLIITYYWPPAGGPGVQRWLKFVKYLRDYGWEPVVLTVRDGVYPAVDGSLVDDIPDGVAVYRTRAGGPFGLYSLLKGQKRGRVPVALISDSGERTWFDRFAVWIRSNCFIPDARKGWYRHALRGAAVVMQHHTPSLVVTSGPPHSTHLIGRKVSRRYGLPWVADFRDPWTTVYYNHLMPRTPRTERIDREYEEGVLRDADAILTVSRAMQEEYAGRAMHVEVIRNGYDESDMPSPVRDPAPSDRFVLLHTGNIAPNQHVPVLWDVLAELCRDDASFRDRLLVRLAGNVDASTIGYLHSVGLSDRLEVNGYVPHREATTMMHQASLLLLLIPDAPGNRAIVTGKIFEYLLAGVPVLGLGPDGGDADLILRETERGEMIAYDHKGAIMEKLKECYKRWVDDGRVTNRLPNEPCLPFSRRKGTEQLAVLFESLMEESAQKGVESTGLKNAKNLLIFD